ncbi:MAG: ribosomal L7Ae/L30e/S12e/Gadd45 family protein [Anaerovibrio sp.]|uniref:L7Ae/L30e/S12e/Gadd45 family ribosomal protein n=1 Tax=Anaerovibrio sp. TaxID=1872532 RepID=UPI0025EC197B|nr:ribosomal L7Ae/L30e/S12e/Gadd45 family protein [Anaerovibrio sp.]MCR5175731.1 ribosomal L7Ae/L30e/S12e/Gadd45 family protein [Anaerovibrio sp.]
MNKIKILNLLSMAQRANKVVSGDFAVVKAADGGKARLILVADDAAEETKKKYQRMAENAGIKLYYLTDKEELGHCIGKEFRAVAAILDKGFADALTKLFEDR